MSVVFKYPKGELFTAMWAQISGMADCCGAGVIGRLSGKALKIKELKNTDLPKLTTPHKSFDSMRDYVMNILPTNMLFAGPPEWLHWAILEDLLQKYNNGKHTPQIKAKSVDTTTFDFENNPYHKFWAGPGYRVQMWFITDRANANYMAHPPAIRCLAFLNFIETNKLGRVWKSDTNIPGSYGSQELMGAILHPNYDTIKTGLATVVAEANKECERRWLEVAPQLKNVTPIPDEVAKKW